MSTDRDLGQIETRVRRFRDDREWLPFHTPKDLAMSISIEAAELLEQFQWKDAEAVRAHLADAAGRDAVAHEMADVLLLLLSLADVTGIDLHAAALEKLALNEAKYPVADSRGHATKYDQL